MTKAQYAAILEIAENGERFPLRELNIPRRTLQALARNGYISSTGAVTLVTPEGWDAIAA